MGRPDWVLDYTNRYVDILASSGSAFDVCSDALPDQNHRVRNALASVRFTTSASQISIEYWCTFAYQQTTIDTFVNGTLVSTITPVSTGSVVTATVNLPSPGTAQLVEVYESEQWPGQIGTAIRRVYVGSGNGLSPITPSAPSRRMVVCGDSIAGGSLAEPESQGWIGLTRADYPGRVTMTGWAGAGIYNRTASGTSVTALANEVVAGMDGTGTNEVWLALVYNDYYGSDGTGIAGWTAAGGFTTLYTALVNAILTAKPAAKIWCAGPIITTVVAANQNGETISTFRSATSALVTALADSRVAYVDAWSWLLVGDLTSDGIHPGTVGHAKYHTQLRSTLGY
jgi:hypothetical protein